MLKPNEHIHITIDIELRPSREEVIMLMQTNPLLGKISEKVKEFIFNSWGLDLEELSEFSGRTFATDPEDFINI